MLTSICLFFIWEITRNSALENKLPSYSLKSKFPIYEGENFFMEFIGTEKKLLPYSTIIFICQFNKKILQEEFITPGFLKALPQSIKGNYFNIQNYTVDSSRVEVVLLFNKSASENVFEFMFIESASRKFRLEITDNKKYAQYKLGSFNISLLFHWKLEFIQKTLDHREDGIHLNSTGILICRATEGSPFSQVRFVGIKTLDQQRLTTDTNVNEVRLTFHSKIEDHMRRCGCQAGNDIIHQQIKIFHHPTALIFTPPRSQFVRNGSSILCQSEDGYPSPRVHWTWISGPNNSQLFYKIHNQANILEMSGSAPLGSSWTFKCNASNTIPNSRNKGVLQAVSFQIGEKPISKIVIVVIVVSIVIFLVMFTCAVYHLRNRKIGFSQSQSFEYLTVPTNNTTNNQLYPNQRCQSEELLLQIDRTSGIKSTDAINNSKYSIENHPEKELFYPIDEV